MLLDVTDEAAADLLEIVDRLSEFSPAQALRLVGAFEGVLSDLRQLAFWSVVETFAVP